MATSESETIRDATSTARIPPSLAICTSRPSNAAPAPLSSFTEDGGDPSTGLDNLNGPRPTSPSGAGLSGTSSTADSGSAAAIRKRLEDAAAAIDYLATLEGVDTERVVAIGHSAGGHLAVWAAGRSKLAAQARRRRHPRSISPG